ncbi:hypothetical protein DPX16_19312 [Anabarilius grahami]|uniref:Uncharacterized protein n=1 Tax=Anabarilius grahami TaxID=495550 RepID=A0A3N0Z0Q7_ANAGA|nr:hypothetical protein DPX16_19312 [Anabarilius grahami]
MGRNQPYQLLTMKLNYSLESEKPKVNIKDPIPGTSKGYIVVQTLQKRHFPEPETSLSFIDPHSLCQQTHYLTPRQSSMRRKTRCCQAVVLMERDLRCFVNTADKSMDG